MSSITTKRGKTQVLKFLSDVKVLDITVSKNKEILEAYKEQDNSVEERLTCSIINACITQHNAYFILTEKNAKHLLTTDQNYVTHSAFKNGKWPKIRRKLLERGIFSIQIPGCKKRPNVYKIMPELIALMMITKEEESRQLKEITEFIKNEIEVLPSQRARSEVMNNSIMIEPKKDNFKQIPEPFTSENPDYASSRKKVQERETLRKDHPWERADYYKRS